MFSLSFSWVSLSSTLWVYLCPKRGRVGCVSALLFVLVMLSALTVDAASTACPTCGLPGMEKGEEDLIEIAKQQILSKLHLRERPNITHTLPRTALMTALRKLHVGRVRQDGSLDLEKNLLNPQAGNQAYEIVSFADVEDDVSAGLSFQFLQEKDRSVQVLQSSLWLYVQPTNGSHHAVTADIYLLEKDSGNRTLLLQRSVEATRGGWHTFPVTTALQDFLDEDRMHFRLEVHCEKDGRNLCDHASGDSSQRPFLVAQVRQREDGSKHALSKRSLRCGEDASVCCKKDFYVKFRDIHWQDWIIAPEGYHMNYCMGQCPQHLSGSPGIASSFHATVFSQLKANGIHSAVSSCCVPIQRRPLSMVYFNSQHIIVKMDVPDMIVESCGCT